MRPQIRGASRRSQSLFSRLTPSNFQLVGGLRIPTPFLGAGFAIDWAGGKIFTTGGPNVPVLQEFSVPNTWGTGTDISSWPIAVKTTEHANFWGREGSSGYAGGMRVENNTLWVAQRVYYDTAPLVLHLKGKNLTTGVISTIETTLSTPAFGGGFIKGHADVLVGCGGYESGQGAIAGPSCARLDGTILLQYPDINASNTFATRAPREANYEIVEGNGEWVGYNPVNGEGRWACDRVYGGGIWHERGLCYWPHMGIGSISYAYQTETFSIGSNQKNYLYTFDPTSFNNVQYSEWTHGFVQGSEIGPDGRIYLQTRDSWASQLYTVDAAVKIFQIVN